jgi:ribonuclease VapC
MVLSVRNPEAAGFTREISRRTSETLTEAIIEAGARALDLFLHRSRFETVAVAANRAAIAWAAFRRFGRGRHPARLNFGECCACALAVHAGEPLLFRGDGFAATDVTPC